MIDLHTHSVFSDGSDTPEQLVDGGLAAGLRAMALTDHDTVGGLDQFREAAAGSGMLAVPGIEMSSVWLAHEVHIVGLFIDPAYEGFQSILEENRRNREIRNRGIIRKLAEKGYAVTYSEVLEVSGGESVGRPHIARVLVNKGYFERTQQVFEQLIRRGQSCYVPRQLPQPADVIRIIRAAGGVAIWAHPVSGLQTGERSYVKKMLKYLIPAGLDGMETFYSSFNVRQSNLLTEIAGINRLLRSGGSDYHGANQLSIHIGTGGGMLCVPDDLLTPIRTLAEDRKAGKS